jgi:hypothetical protein
MTASRCDKIGRCCAHIARRFTLAGNKKAPDNAGAFELRFSRDQYFATTGLP